MVQERPQTLGRGEKQCSFCLKMQYTFLLLPFSLFNLLKVGNRDDPKLPNIIIMPLDEAVAYRVVIITFPGRTGGRKRF